MYRHKFWFSVVPDLSFRLRGKFVSVYFPFQGKREDKLSVYQLEKNW